MVSLVLIECGQKKLSNAVSQEQLLIPLVLAASLISEQSHLSYVRKQHHLSYVTFSGTVGKYISELMMTEVLACYVLTKNFQADLLFVVREHGLFSIPYPVYVTRLNQVAVAALLNSVVIALLLTLMDILT